MLDALKDSNECAANDEGEIESGSGKNQESSIA